MFNTHTTLICCCGTKPNLTLLERLVARDLKVEWEHFFKLFFSDLDEKRTFAAYERHAKGNSETSLSCLKIYLPCRVLIENRKYSSTLDNFSLSIQQLVLDYFLYPSKGSDVYLQEILAQFSPNNTPPLLAAIWRSLRPV